MYAKRLTEKSINDRIVKDIDANRFRSITESTLEGLAKKELNLSAIIGKSVEAKERRLVPEVIEEFFVDASDVTGIKPKETRQGSHIYRIGRVPRNLWPIGERLEPRFGKLGREYKQIVFDKSILKKDPTCEWVTPGHPLFETVREDVTNRVRTDLQRGAVFYDVNSSVPYRLDVFSASIIDGRGHPLNRKLFVIQINSDGSMAIKQPTIFIDLATTDKTTQAPAIDGLPNQDMAEQFLIENSLNPFLAEVSKERAKDTETIKRHIEISLNELIDRQNLKMAELLELQQKGDSSQPLAANIKQVEDRIDVLNGRLEGRREELKMESQCLIGDIKFIGRAWVLPHPERSSPDVSPMVRNDEIEKIAVDTVIAYEKEKGRICESVEKENRGFDLISRKPHPEDPQTATEVRFIEVKGRSEVGEIALSPNEYKTAERLRQDYWLYVVYTCSTNPEVNVVNDPVRLGWKPLVKVEHYHASASEIKRASR